MNQPSLHNFRIQIVPLMVAVLIVLTPSLGTAANSAATATYIQQLSDPDWQVRRAAALELGALADAGKTSVAPLTVALGDDDSRVRRAAANALGQIGPDASRSIPALIILFNDIDPSVIESAARAVGLMGSRASHTSKGLTTLLGHPDARVRGAAAESIGKIGRNARRSMPELSQRLGDSEPAVRSAAARSLGEMGATASSYAPRLLRLLDDDDPGVREAASQALSQIGKPAVDGLIHALNSGNPIVLQSIVETLGKIGPSATPMLIKALQSDSEQLLVRQYVAMALARIGAADRRVLPALIATLDNEKSDLRRSAAEALGDIGPPAIAALPKLITLSSNQREDVVVREFSIAALARIAPQDAAVKLAIVGVVDDGDPRIYQAGITALVSIGTTTTVDDDVSGLIQQLDTGLTEARIGAAQRLGEIGPHAVGAVSGLTNTLADSDNSIELRIASAQSLGLIGPEAEAAVPELILVLGNENRQLSDTALVSLGRIGPQSRTIPALLQALRSGDPTTRAAGAEKLQRFVMARSKTWEPFLIQSAAPVMRNWLASHAELYGVDPDASNFGASQPRGNSVEYFDVLGGRAAIRESIQLNLIDEPLTGVSDSRPNQVSSIRSVRVASHPFEEMLEDSNKPTLTIPLAEFSPPDHFFAYFRTVDSVLDVISGGAEQFLRFESALAVKSVEYNIQQRYLNRFGLDTGILGKLKEVGGIGDLAIITPDLFLIDGTDITVVATLMQPQLMQAALHLLGRNDAGVDIATLTLPGDLSAYWAIRGNVLAISSSADELSAVLAANDNRAKNSLGRSSEFLYMLQQMGLEESTDAYFYFSDPFIRHLVSPEVKIAQLRRMQARAEMEMLVAGALLYLLDGHKSVPSKDVLIAWNYVPRYFENRDYTIGEDLIVNSDTYGTLAALKPLRDIPVSDVSDREKKAYEAYVDNYSRYWRQFFDPISVRLDKVDTKTREISTFILPLLESQLYDQVKEALATVESGRPLHVPVMSPRPSMVFSLNVSDDLRISLSQKLASALVQYTSINPDIFDSIGSGVHLAVQDSTPVVALGSGDIWGALNGDMLLMEGFESFLPFLFSLMTQPATVLIELAEPTHVKDFLNDAVVRRSDGESQGEFHRLQDKEAWVYSLNILDMFQLHLLVEIKSGYLLISNLPWSTQLAITEIVEMDLNGAQLQLNLNEMTQQLPALHTKVFTDYRRAAVDGMGHLYPLLATGVAETVPEAIEKHLEVFGFSPIHPYKGQWEWRDSQLQSTEFGTALRPVQPEFREGQMDFGVFPALEMIGINTQLESSGLRTRIRWRTVN